MREQRATKPVEYERWTVALYLLLGSTARTVCMCFPDYFKDRIELTSSVASFDRVVDGIAMIDDGVSPYSSNFIHYPPLLLHLYRTLWKMSILTIPIQSLALDTFTAYFIYAATRKVLKAQKNPDAASWALLSLQLYVFNPAAIASCSIYSVSVLYNFLAALALRTFIRGTPESQIFYTLLISVWSSFTIYPLALLSSTFAKHSSPVVIISTIMIAVGSSCFIGLMNSSLSEDSTFLESTYGHILNYEDLSPNSGMFWYFFVQVFEHFRPFYVALFNSLYWLMQISLTLCIRDDSILHWITCLLVSVIFFPYPTLNFASPVFAMFPMLAQYQKYPRYHLLTVSTVVVTVCLMPVMWHMWIVSSSGNANFFFAAVLVYNLALIYMFGDLLFVYFRKQIDDRYFSDLNKKQAKFTFDLF